MNAGLREAHDSSKFFFAGVNVTRHWDGGACRAWEGSGGWERVVTAGRPDGSVRHTCSDHGRCADCAAVRQGGHNVLDIIGAAALQHLSQGHP